MVTPKILGNMMMKWYLYYRPFITTLFSPINLQKVSVFICVQFLLII